MAVTIISILRVFNFNFFFVCFGVNQGVESANCPGFTRAFEYNAPTLTVVKRTLADGLAVPVVGYNAFVTAAPLIDKMLVVQEEWIALAILRLVEEDKCVVEGAGASALAAILAGLVPELRGKKYDSPLF